LFNAALEGVMRRWKQRLRSHGLLLTEPGAHERLTNIRYADDLLLFCKSLGEATEMLELLDEELKAAGLAINQGKTKILTTTLNATSGACPMLADIGDMFVEIVQRDSVHKYLGKVLPGDLRARGQFNLEHRLSLAWFKFHNLHQVLTNQRIPCALRLRLFDAVVSPTAVYSLNTTPLTASQMAKLDATQRRMMRRIVGWTRYDDEAWEETGKRMKRKLEVALSARPVLAWSEARNKNRARMSSRISEGTAPVLVQLAHAWQPAYTRTSAKSTGREEDPGRDGHDDETSLCYMYIICCSEFNYSVLPN